MLSVQNAVGEVEEVLHHELGTQHSMSNGELDMHDDDHEDSHCQHCCHAHASMSSLSSSHVALFSSCDDHLPYSARAEKLTQGPPTPPPTI